jgi:hypothetical protein
VDPIYLRIQTHDTGCKAQPLVPLKAFDTNAYWVAIRDIVSLAAELVKQRGFFHYTTLFILQVILFFQRLL